MPDRLATYLEPFAGSACLFFAVRPSSGVLGDFNAELIEAYHTIRRHPRLVARNLTSLGSGPADYYRIRALDPRTLPDVDRAARFVYLNRHCFNGVYRTNRKGQFNVPLGTRLGALPAEKDFYRCSVALRAASLVPGEFDVTLQRARRGDFAYLDPPYSTSGRPSYGEYGYGAFTKGDQNRLLDQLSSLDKRGVTVLLSYAEDPNVVDALGGWSVVSYDVRRKVGGTGDRRSHAREILASNTQDVRAAVAAASASATRGRSLLA